MENNKVDVISSIMNYDVFLRFIKNDEVRLFIACQICLESDYLRSPLVYDACNATGMKKPFRRFSSAIGDSNGFAKYASVPSSFNDYLLWIFYNRPYQNVFDSVDNFIIFLRNSGYCPEKDYISKIQSIYSQFKNLLK